MSTSQRPVRPSTRVDGWSLSLMALAALLALPARSLAIAPGQVDDFQLSTANWTRGTRESTGGPAGVGDAFLQLAAGSAGVSPNLVTFNTTQWSGDYISAGITAISVMVQSAVTEPLELRLAFGTELSPSFGGDWYSSIDGISVPASSGWMEITFPISESALTLVQGTATYDAVMSDVTTMRFMHALEPAARGSAADGVLGVDNITAIVLGTLLAADFDEDGDVDGDDFLIWQAGFGSDDSGDADGDGDTDGDDFLTWQAEFGHGTGDSATAVVPEPAGLLLLAALVLGVVPARLRTC